MSEKATDISGGTGELAESGVANAEIEPQATPIAASDIKEETDEATHPVNAANAEQRNQQQHAQSPSRTASPPDVRCESPTQSCSDRSLLEPNELEELDDVVPELDLSYLSLNNLDFLSNGTAGPVALSDHLPVPPDGGYGWVIVLAAFFSNFVVDGMANCFAVFLPEYQRFFNSSKGTTALVGSLLIGSYLLIGPVAGGLVNKYGARPVVMAGAVISTVAIVVSVYSTNIFIFMIIFGVCGGIGFGLIYLPAIVMVGYYFEKKRALATGIAVAGSGVGTFVFPPLAVILIEHFGWQGTLWLLSGLVLNCAVFGALYLPLESRRDPTELQRKLSTQGAQLKNALSRMSFAVSNIGSEMDMRPASVISKQQNGEQPAMLSPDTPARRFHPTPIGRKNSLSKSDLETFARIRSALSECEDGLSRADGESPSSPVKTQLSPIEEHRPLAKSRSGSTHHAPIFVPPRSRKTTLTSQISDYSRLNLNTMSRRDLVATNQISRLSARSYAQSLSRINGSQPLKAAQSLFSVQGVDPKEFTRPMSRRDIFLQGSITNLPEFKEEGGNFKNFRESQISIPMAVLKHDDLVDGPLPVDFIGDDDFYEEPAPFLCGAPAAVRNVFAEMVDVSLLRDPVMVLLCVSNILGMLGFYVPFVFYVDMAMKNEIAEAQASLLLSYIGITNTLGRIFFGWFADQGWVSALTINNAALVACGIITLACPLLTTYYLMVAYAIIFGFIISSYICLTSIILSDLLGVERLTNSFGLLVVSRGIACLIGSPIAGTVYDLTQSYFMSFFFAGLLILGAGLVSCAIPWIVWRRKKKENNYAQDHDDHEMGKLAVVLEHLSEEDEESAASKENNTNF